jgi:hypothetical protein
VPLSLDQRLDEVPLVIRQIGRVAACRGGGSRHRELSSCGHPSLLPDTVRLPKRPLRKIIKPLSFVDYNGQDFGETLFTSSVDASNLHQLTPFSFDIAIEQDWAPAGRQLVFTDNADFPQPDVSANILTIRTDGTDMHPLPNYTGGQVNAFTGSYSPDGHWIVFRLEDHGMYGLYRIDADGGHMHTILPLSSFRPWFIDWEPAPEH